VRNTSRKLDPVAIPSSWASNNKMTQLVTSGCTIFVKPAGSLAPQTYAESEKNKKAFDVRDSLTDQKPEVFTDHDKVAGNRYICHVPATVENPRKRVWSGVAKPLSVLVATTLARPNRIDPFMKKSIVWSPNGFGGGDFFLEPPTPVDDALVATLLTSVP